MAQIWTGVELSIDPLVGKKIAVLGYGNQGRAQALNMRDRGLSVQVGNRRDEYEATAQADGFDVFPIGAAATDAEILMLLLPDEVQAEVFETDLRAILRPGQTISFASGYNITFEFITVPEEIDVVMVAPRMIGRGVRELPKSGRGFPTLVGVEHDASGHALETALALAAAIGAGHPEGCAVASSFQEETLMDLFSEHTSASATVHFLKACCEALIEAGVSPEAAILETYASGELGEIGLAMAQFGLIEQMRLHSRTSQFGQLKWGSKWVTDSVRAQLREAINSIRDGTFAHEWQKDQSSGLVEFNSMWSEIAKEPIFADERRLFERLGRK